MSEPSVTTCCARRLLVGARCDACGKVAAPEPKQCSVTSIHTGHPYGDPATDRHGWCVGVPAPEQTVSEQTVEDILKAAAFDSHERLTVYSRLGIPPGANPANIVVLQPGQHVVACKASYLRTAFAATASVVRSYTP